MISHTNNSKIPDELNIINSPGPDPAVMRAMARNHWVVATSTSVDPAQVARSQSELMSGRFSGLVPEDPRVSDVFVCSVALWWLLQSRKKGK